MLLTVCSMCAATSPYTGPGPQQANSNKCKGKLTWDKVRIGVGSRHCHTQQSSDAKNVDPANDNTRGATHSYAAVTVRTKQRDIRQMMAAVEGALASTAGPDRKLAALLPCVAKLQKALGMDDRELMATILYPEFKEYLDNVKATFSRLNESGSNEARSAKIAIASGLLNENSNKAAARRDLGVGRRTANQAVQHKKAFGAAVSAHEAAKALMPTPR